MDFQRPNEISLNPVLVSLRSDLEALTQEINKDRQLSATVLARLTEEITRDRVHQSNAIEGNTLALRETQAVLAAGQLIDVGRKREPLEALNLGRAIRQIQNGLDAKTSYGDESFFLGVHKTLFTELRDDIAGHYRVDPPVIRGAKHQPPREIKPYLTTVFEVLSNPGDLDPVLLATWTHWTVSRIHPFEDGNGRMARLWQDFVLLSHRLTPAIIRFSERDSYYAALAQADEGDFSDLLQLVLQSAIRTSQTYLDVIRENDNALDWAKAIVGESEQKIDDKLKLEFARWTSRVVELRDAFRRCVTLLNRVSSDFEFVLHELETIPQATWESLRSEARTADTWCFRIVASTVGKRFQYVFFAGKHFRSEADASLNLAGPQVNLIVSEKCGPEDSLILREGNIPISLREILILDGKLTSAAWDKDEQKLVYERNASSMKIAQRFLEEVIRHRLTV